MLRMILEEHVQARPRGGAPAHAVSAHRWRAFCDANPGYRDTAILDRLRHRDFRRLDTEGHVYLDYTGGGLYGDWQIRRHAALLLDKVLGNPHSSNPTSAAATEMAESCRRHVLDFFGASPDEYAVIFTANASHALKLVGESYPFDRGGRFLLTFDNHNSVNGIREYDRARGAETTYVPVVPPDLRVDEDVLDRELGRVSPGTDALFAFPAQSNFSGVRHPLDWIERAQARGWDVLLDAAAFVPTNRLDLGAVQPDFVALSFYKMFGYPTGVGALIARRRALAKLHRPWFAGGTIAVASVQADRYVLAPGSEAFEDGTLNYTSLPAVDLGLTLLEQVGVDLIHRRVEALTGWLIDGLTALRHGNGEPLVRLYGPRSTDGRGGTLALNFCDRSGRVLDQGLIERRATARKISLRTGCFCNPGAGELALGLTREQISTCLDDSDSCMTYDDFRRCIDSESTGAVRISLGMVSTFGDVETFLAFAETFLE
jgi:selenocysteine lyase/cysteine desulfurase